MKKFIVYLLLGMPLLLMSNPAKVNHQYWDQLLQKHVSRNGVVSYSGFKNDAVKLNEYLAQLKSNHPKETWSKKETMAYWINAYNAFTVRLILDNMPTTSIMNINGGKAWDMKFIKIEGKLYSLNDIEHKKLRAIYKDPRIHFAVNCASFSCPRLSNKAFTAVNLEEHLNKMAVSFVNNPSKNKLTSNSIQISQLFEWYKDDFTMKGSIIDFINTYSKVKVQANAKVSYLKYDWNLNN